ncbi:TPA: ABC transporter ATP-binding protein [Streptococcus pyogenes]|uniref:ABC transporter ATP-binding protein n=1 Tax=Streptococcus pyogenes TaxID=1314 RepID=UPI000DF8C7CF|nr:ABC transporter ATP-binding protein [Streptococcus pyogenes]QCK43911.1 ABC transporter ATP-binding protein [Streptococcus pyogenes]SUO61417.1 ABC transporter [Streptococcus pyogenes]VHF49016.1 ABC transporter [Streptococcus pyogenes]VHG35109.1 ABC transporter [Streptococcus pyogenes]VHK08949.1 ABC transporter [Streptococcus pyogenes]
MIKTDHHLLKRVLQDLLKKPLPVCILVIASFVQVGLSVYLPVLIGKAVDMSLSVNSWQTLKWLLGQMLVIIVVNTLIQWVMPLVYSRLLYQYSQQLKDKLLEKIHRLPFAYLDRQTIGDLVSRVITDTEQLINGLQMVFNQFILGLLTILCTIIAMAQIDWLMLILVLVLTPSSLFLARFIAQKSFHYAQAQTKSRGNLAQFTEEILRQEGLVQLFNAQEQSICDYYVLNKTYCEASQKAIFYASTVNPATRFINSVIYALLAGLGAVRIMAGLFSVGQLTTFLNVVVQYTKPFNDISSVLAEIQSSLACAQRLYDLLDIEIKEQEHFLTFKASAVKGQIDFEEVSFSYQKDRPLLKDINFSVPAGSKVAIVGPTGAGKSTLINLLMRFYELDAGSIKLDKVPIKCYAKEELRSITGMVLQETWLKDATVHELIAYGSEEASRDEVVAAAKAAHAHFFIMQLPKTYDTYLSASDDALSQGQLQLLAIARMFLKKPKVLILDEATSSIDIRTEAVIQEALKELMRGRTSFIIAHRLSTIQSADLILVMDQGRLVEWGTHASLMSKNGCYARLQKIE